MLFTGLTDAKYSSSPMLCRIHYIPTERKERKAKGGLCAVCGRTMKDRPVGSRSKAIARLIRDIVIKREADTSWLSLYVPNYKRRLRHYESGDRQISLDAFIDLMTALKCEVVVIPRGRWSEWYRLNDFPDNDGNVLKMPNEIKKGRKKKRLE